MSEDVQFTVTGVENLNTTLTNLIAKYPDKAGKMLRKEATNLRKDVVANAQTTLESDGSSKKSLKKTGQYRVSQVKGFGQAQYVEMTARAPHFHLVENGHNMVTPSGNTVGHVEGKKFMEKAVDSFDKEFDNAAERMVDNLLKEAGLI